MTSKFIIQKLNLEFDFLKAAVDEAIQRHTPIRNRDIQTNQTIPSLTR